MQKKHISLSFAMLAGKILLLASVFLLTGQLGLTMAVTPGYASIIWPPAGIAMGMLLLHGLRLWPGIFIGAFVLNLLISNESLSGQSGYDSVLMAFGMALGCTLQVLLACWLIKKFHGFPVEVKKFRDLAVVLFWAGPVSSIVMAAFGMFFLFLTHSYSVNMEVYNGLILWIGNTLGVLVFLPLILLIPGTATSTHWQKKNASSLPALALIILMMPLGLTFYMWRASNDYIQKENYDNFQALTQESEKALLYRMESYKQSLRGAAGFFKGSDDVSRVEWTKYVQAIDIRKNFPGINGMGFIAKVSPENLDSFVNANRSDNAPDFNIHPDVEGDNFFIIQYSESVIANTVALGLNIAFEKNRFDAAIMALDTGQAAISKKIYLLNDDTKSPGFILLQPSYKWGMPINTVEERRNAFMGWIYAPFIGKNFLRDFAKNHGSTLNLKVYDGSEESSESLIYDSSAQDELLKHSKKIRPPQFTLRKEVDISQQKWTLVWSSTPKYEYTVKSQEPTIIAVSGLAFTIMFGVFLMFMAYRTQTVNRLVHEKTLEISANEERLKLLIRNTPAAVAMFDTEMRYIMLSDSWARDYGLVGQNVIGKSYYDVFPDIKNLSRWLDIHKRGLQGETLSMEEDSWKRADGRIEWNKWAIHPWVNSEGNVGGIVMFTEIITERKESEIRAHLMREIAVDAAEAQRMEDVIGSVLHNICTSMGWPVGHAYVWDEKKGVFETSHMWYFDSQEQEHSEFRKISSEFTFRPGVGLPGRVWMEKKPVFIADVETDDNFPRNKSLKKISLHAAIGIPILVHNKVEVVLEFFSPHRIDLNRVPMAFYEMLSLQLSRVIERSKAEQALEESRRLNEAILSSAEYLIIATDRIGNVLLFNRQAERMMGYKASEVVGRIIPRKWLVAEEFKDRHEALQQEYGAAVQPNFDVFSVRAINNGVDVSEWTFIRKDGSEFPVSLAITPIKDGEGVIVGFLGIGEDITARRAMENMKSEFISIVSHELRTPLTSIRGSLGLIEGAMSDELPEKVQKLISLAHKNSERLILLINDILDIDKMSAGQMRFDMRPEKLAPLLQQAIDSNASYAEKFGGRYILEYVDEKLVIFVDPDRFIQVVTNMLSNAAKFSPEGDIVKVSVERRDLNVRILIEDHGPGIPLEFQERIFGKFSQADSSMTRKKGGTGLGLHISRELIERMKGHIGFDTKVGEGTTFWIELPLILDEDV